LRGEVIADLTTTFLGQTLSAPIGVAPVGMSGLMWPDAECTLARLGAQHSIPYCMSNVATQTPETLAPHIGDQGWFQLYAPRDPEIRRDMLRRIKNAGFHTLVLTVDVPTASRRERQRRGGLSQPPALTPRILAQVMQCPAWAIGTLKTGMPKLRFLQSYSTHKGPLPSTAHIGYLLRTAPDWDYLRALRDDWDGKLIVKGVLKSDDAKALTKEGVDAIWVSNHAGRQFDGGLDVLRAIAKGADLVMLGRAFHYGLGAFGPQGADHVVKILTQDIAANMGQMGIATPTGARDHLI
jgi:L-lactate dehydrogenase (cytochrome)